MVLLEGIYSTVIMRDILERENHKGQKRITDPVLLKKLRRGYDVSIGKIDNSEVDFIATNTNDKMYAQVTEAMTSEVLQEGDIIESRYAIRRRDRTIHGRMRGFLYEMTHSEQWDSVILPVGDGALLSYKKTNVKQM